jgi:hypothetical protein
MAIAAILLGVFAFIAMFAGVILTIIPYAGAIFSALALIASVVGIVLAGLGKSRATQDGESTTPAMVGLVLNIVGVIFALLVFMTCGLCNACLSAGGAGNGMRAVSLDGGGVYFTNQPGNAPPGSPFAPPSAPAEPSLPAAPEALPADPAAPPPAFPPPAPAAEPAPAN